MNAVVDLREQDDARWMRHAIELAKRAATKGEVPVGAVLIADNHVVGEGYNCSIERHDPSAHAEIVAIRSAGDALSNYRLPDTTLFVTLEPCVMCAGAIVHARIARVVYGASDPRAGAVESVMSILDHGALNHRATWRGGVEADVCGALLKDFFKAKRTESEQSK